MPKHENNNGRASNGQQQSKSTSRRQLSKEDQIRENLLEKILEGKFINALVSKIMFRCTTLTLTLTLYPYFVN